MGGITLDESRGELESDMEEITPDESRGEFECEMEGITFDDSREAFGSKCKFHDARN